MARSFSTTLKEHALSIKRAKTTTLQINVGFICNLTCKHCHLNAGPGRNEVMDRKTMDEVISFAQRNNFEIADITGGAPEMVPDLVYLIENLSPLVSKMILRSNLVLLLDKNNSSILQSVRENKVSIVASFPSVNKNQTNNQRGGGVWQKCIENLKHLNSMGYGIPGSPLELILVSNPTGAFMPADQCKAEEKFKKDLARKWGIQFTNLFTFANVPLGRFRAWLEKSNNYTTYMEKLSGNFNASTVNNLMCRSLISVAWNGTLHDCDFNLAAGLPFNTKTTHISEINTVPEEIGIATDDHCFACTAGSGFT